MRTDIICFEGISGAGKTTQSFNIEKYLKSKNKDFLIINEKKYEPFKQTVIDWHNAGRDAYFSYWDIIKFAKARGETHKKHFIPLIGELDYLIFDRSYYTSGVYQTNDKFSCEDIINMNIKEGAIRPEKGIIMLCSPQTAMQRTNERKKKRKNYSLPSMNETIEELTKRRKLYIELSKTHQELYLIDTTNKVKAEVFEEIKRRLNL